MNRYSFLVLSGIILLASQPVSAEQKTIGQVITEVAGEECLKSGALTPMFYRDEAMIIVSATAAGKILGYLDENPSKL